MFMTPNVCIPEERLSDFCRKWQVAELSLFGSVLRTDFSPTSDVDVMIQFAADMPWSLFDWISMCDELQEMFGRGVDLVDQSGLRNPFRRHEIMSTREVIYAA